MRNLFLTFLLISFSLFANGQGRVNPFEIRQRVPLTKAIDTSYYANMPADSAGVVSVPTPAATALITLTDTAVTAIKPGLSDNPFEVDHVPIRKSQFSKRKEKLETSISSTKSSNGFLIWFLFFTCGLLAIVINTQSKTLTFIPQTLYNENILKLVHREESNKSSAFFIFLYTIFLINISAAIYLILGHYGGERGIKIFLMILGCVFGVYIVRHSFLSLLGNLFDISKNTNLYSFTILLFNAFMGLCLIPINFIMAYSPEHIKGPTVIFCMVLIGILLLLRVLRGLLIASEFIFSRLFQFIVYLCGFEIAPILVGVKFLMKVVVV